MVDSMSKLLPLLLISPNFHTKRLLMQKISNLQLFDIDVVPDSETAIEHLKQTKYQFIISEISIGKVDGWSLSSLIRSDIYQCDKQIPIVLITDTHCERIAEATAKSFGINAVVTTEEIARLNEILADAFSSQIPVNTRLTTLSVISDPALSDQLNNLFSSKFVTVEAESAKQGLAIIRQQNVDLVVIDSDLENDATLALLNTIRQEKPELSVVVIVPKNDTSRAEFYMIHGASDFIYNPINVSRIINVCERAAQRNDFIISNKQFAEKVTLLELSKQKFQNLSDAHTKLLENLSSVVLELDTTGRIKFVNKAWEALTGYSIEDSLNLPLVEFIEFDELGSQRFNHQLNGILMQSVTSTTAELKIKTVKNNSVWVEIRLHQLYMDGFVQGITATLDNIDDRKQAEEKLQHLALHDTLTGLYNRYYFDNELSRLTLLASRGKETHSLLYIDLDHFKVINDTEGHQMGDLVLKEVAQILTLRLRQSDILCRVGGDEFIILLAETKLQNAINIGESICQQIAAAHFQFGNTTYKISASIGVSEIDGVSTPAEYLRQADIALYVAKKKGRNRTHSYETDDVDSTKQLDNMKWVQKLQQAVIDDQLVMHFQPVWDYKNDCVGYFEALVRLQINESITYPNEFIPALERAEDVSFLDHQVINKTIKLIKENPGLHKVAINLSGQAFSDERLLPLIKEKLSFYQVSGERIIFELTESASLTNVSGTRRMIEQLSLIGCQFSIDDFGTGFSTFSYLKELPAHSVKIDGSFVKDMISSDIDRTLVTAIANVAKVLKKHSVAEFVETKEIFNHLDDIGVTYAQGYYISKPLPLSDALKFKFTP
ncbi:EAL domain-containing protein [Psychrosphaera haliotis]|uniref:EAL domain-containing protein n=2 Tax=Psychrosphaera haliotis TaxID=555083 RepID=A0A6N8FCV4_9GAMM|nr:EAL domain-containing protein [Psychrosphaera haliotis]